MNKAPQTSYARFAPTTGRIHVTLSKEVLAEGYQQGIARWKQSKKTNPKLEIRNALATLAVTTLCGEKNAKELVVRITDKRDGGLNLPKNIEASKPYVLALIETFPNRFGDFTTGNEKLDDLIDMGKIPQFSATVSFAGHIFGKDVKDEHWFESGTMVECVVPQEDLASMKLLSDTYFQLPETDEDVFEQALIA